MTATHEFDLVCIGSGPAGQRAAVQAAKLGKRVAVVEKRRVVGGLCLGTGTIPSKTFRGAVLSFVEHNHVEHRSPTQHISVRPTWSNSSAESSRWSGAKSRWWKTSFGETTSK